MTGSARTATEGTTSENADPLTDEQLAARKRHVARSLAGLHEGTLKRSGRRRRWARELRYHATIDERDKRIADLEKYIAEMETPDERIQVLMDSEQERDEAVARAEKAEAYLEPFVAHHEAETKARDDLAEALSRLRETGQHDTK